LVGKAGSENGLTALRVPARINRRVRMDC